MKINSYIRYGLFVTVSFLAIKTNAQEGDKNVKQKLTDEKGNPTLITFTKNTSYKSSDFVQVFKDQLHLKNNSNFLKIATENDRSGFVHDKYQLFHNGVKVEFATYTLHSKNGVLISMNGETYPLEKTNTTPKISKQQAFTKALNQIGAKTYLWDSPAEAAAFNYTKPEGELVLVPVDTNDSVTLRLAYKFDIYATNPVSRGDLYIDAVTGNSIFYNAIIKHLGEYSHGKLNAKKNNIVAKSNASFVSANADTKYSGPQTIQTSLSGTNYILADATRGLGVNTFNMKKGTSYTAAVNFTDADNNWTALEYANTNKDNGALDAHWGAEKTYDYWSTVHGRNSYNNAGAQIKSYVHYSNAYDNAYWNGSVMTYGDGSGTYFDILTSIDVAAHEIGHAVCSNTSNLTYQKESGAMNEAFSDIWGACVEFFAAPNKQRWLIGEDIERRVGHLSLRSMSNPKAELQPDTYGGTYWKTVNCTPTSTNDYCGVHTNSGVLNHWFYILTEGKTGTNDKGNSYYITGIGIDKAAKIAFRTESVYLTANSTYANARTYGIQAAIDLYGVNSPEVIATTNAFYAVGIGTAFAGPADTIVPTDPTNLVASGTSISTTNLSWTASTDNIGVTGYNVYQGTTLVGTTTATTFNVSGLTATTTYTFTIKAIDAAGNLSAASNSVVVTTLTPVPDTTAPTTVIVSATATTSTTTTLSWTTATDNVGVTGYSVYQGTTLLGTTTLTTFNVTGLVAVTSYNFTVQAKDAAGNISADSNVVTVTTLPTPIITYCTSQGTSTTREKISKVTLGSINNSSTGSTGYENFTSISSNAVRGTSYTITITPTWTSTKYKEGYAVWIDFNRDGDFLDTGEKVWTKAASTTSPVSGTFTIPTTATLGLTRMRVQMKYNAIPTSCEVFSNGQVEDYTLNIALTAAGITTETTSIPSNDAFEFTLYPNPTNSHLTVALNDENATYEIVSFLGQVMKTGKITTEGIDVSELSSGVYILKVNNNIETVSKKFIKE